MRTITLSHEQEQLARYQASGTYRRARNREFRHNLALIATACFLGGFLSYFL